MSEQPSGQTAQDLARRIGRRQRAALRLIYDAEAACGGPGSGYAWAGIGATMVHAGSNYRQVEMHWRSVARLLANGLVDAESYDGRWDDVYLTDLGREVARAITEEATCG